MKFDDKYHSVKFPVLELGKQKKKKISGIPKTVAIFFRSVSEGYKRGAVFPVSSIAMLLSDLSFEIVTPCLQCKKKRYW